MERTAVNPWEWSVSMGFNQGEVVSGHTRTLFCAGQTAVSADGAPQHAGDMAAQISLALDNLESVLEQAGMGLRDVVRLNIYTTDVDRLFEHYARPGLPDRGRAGRTARNPAGGGPTGLPRAAGRAGGDRRRLVVEWRDDVSSDPRPPV